MKPTTQVCLVSTQPVPNLTPVLDPQLRPRHLVLVVAPGMEERAQWLEGVLRPRVESIRRHPVADAWDLAGLHRSMHRLLGELGSRTQPVLNATGGTKLMSLAAYQAFLEKGLPAFYVHPQEDRVIWLPPEQRPSHELADRIRIPDFLAAHGTRVRQPSGQFRSAPRHQRLTEEILRGIRQYQGALGRLNRLAASAEGNLRSDPLKPKERDDPHLQSLIDRFRRHGLLQRRNNRLCFPDEAARFFVNGGWLEQHLHGLLRQVAREDPHIHDIAPALEVTRSQRGHPIPNELDLVFLRDNRLHIIECKTRQFRPGGPDSPAAETLYKLDSLKELMGGLNARAMLVSYRDLAPPHRTRAADLGITLCAGHQLLELPARLKRFAAT